MDSTSDSIPASLKWIEIWRIAFLRPTIMTFLRITSDPKATTRWGILWMGISSFIAWFISPLRAVFWGYVANNLGLQAARYFVWISALVAPILVVIGLLLAAAIAHALARLFGGAGTFHQLVYCWGVMLLPFVVISGLVLYFPSLFSLSIMSTAGRIVQITALLIYAGVNLYLFYAEVVAFSAVEKIGIWKGLGILILQAVIVAIALSCLSSGFNALMIRFARPY